MQAAGVVLVISKAFLFGCTIFSTGALLPRPRRRLPPPRGQGLDLLRFQYHQHTMDKNTHTHMKPYISDPINPWTQEVVGQRLQSLR